MITREKKKMIMENADTLGEEEIDSISTETESVGVESAMWLWMWLFLNSRLRLGLYGNGGNGKNRVLSEQCIVPFLRSFSFSQGSKQLNEVERVKNESPTIL